MPHHRHHIHLICDSKDTHLHPLLDALAIYFEHNAHLSRDLFLVGSDSANYSWRCINECDYVFMLMGQSYGELNNTGVSQLHISYLNAKTKNKPIIAFVVASPDRPRQLSDLIQLVIDQVDKVYNINQSTSLPKLLSDVYEFISKASEASEVTKTEAVTTPTFTPAPPATTTKATPSLLPTSPARYETTSSSKPAPNLQDEVLLNCTAHAFKGGTLIEVGFMASTTWQDILSSLDKSSAFSNQGLWRTLNEVITPQAMPAVKVSHPAVHAISRCQVTKADVLWVQDELHSSGWITPSQSSTTSKQTWRISDNAKKHLV